MQETFLNAKAFIICFYDIIYGYDPMPLYCKSNVGGVFFTADTLTRDVRAQEIRVSEKLREI